MNLHDRIPIITYHSIDNSGSIVSTSPELFRRQMATLRDEGYNTLTLRGLTSLMQAGQWPGQKSVVLTFDDGFENFYTVAAPVLEEHSFTATVFLVTEKCGSFNDWSGNPPELPRSRLLSWQQVKDLSARGIEIGSHSITHPDLTTLEPSDAAKEIRHSKRAIEDAIGTSVTSFAYPFGHFTRAVKLVVEDAYDGACSTDLGRIDRESDRHSLERIDAYYLSNLRSLEMLQSRWMDRYFSVRQVLRNMRSSMANDHSGKLPSPA